MVCLDRLGTNEPTRKFATNNREEKGKERGAVFLSCSHHSIAAAVEHAIDGPPGTVSIAAIEGK
jgi:hypothetical protein